MREGSGLPCSAFCSVCPHFQLFRAGQRFGGLPCYGRHDQHVFHPTHNFSCYGRIAIVAVALSMDAWPKYIMDADEILTLLRISITGSLVERV